MAFPECVEMCCFGERKANWLRGRKSSSCVACSGESALSKELFVAYVVGVLLDLFPVEHDKRLHGSENQLL